MNRKQRRIESGVNKRGLHKVKQGQYLLLVYGTQKWKNFVQEIKLKNGSVKRITHTQLIN